jgi:hypothetical protein
MKKLNVRIGIALVGLTAVLIVAGSVNKAQAGPPSHADVSGFCSDNNDFGRSHGECVSVGEAAVNAVEGRGITEAVAVCKILEGVFGPFPLGQCVSHFASY